MIKNREILGKIVAVVFRKPILAAYTIAVAARGYIPSENSGCLYAAPFVLAKLVWELAGLPIWIEEIKNCEYSSQDYIACLTPSSYPVSIFLPDRHQVSDFVRYL